MKNLKQVLSDWKNSLIDGEFVSKSSLDILESHIIENVTPIDRLVLTKDTVLAQAVSNYFGKSTTQVKDPLFQGVGNE